MGRRTMLLVAAFVVAALGTTLVFLYVNGVNDRALADQKTEGVLVATKQIGAGTTGAAAEEAASWELRRVVKASIADNALADASTIQDKVALAPIFPGEQILSTKFGASANTSSLVIPAEKIAVSVPVAPEQALGNFIVPGTKVAVFITENLPSGPHTELLMPEVEVIAVGDRTLTSGAEAATSSLITFAVTQQEAEKLVSNSQSGTLQLALAGRGASLDVNDGGFTAGGG
jgi:pilus assembly protein CpaB